MTEDLTEKNVQRYFDSMIAVVLDSSELRGLDEKKKKVLAEKIRDHFDDIVLDTLLNRLTTEQLKDLKESMARPEEMEEKIELYASAMPTFYDDLNDRLRNEMLAMRDILS
ncbi:MAG: hypothetical protein COT89_00720 [Candidatus Colwellbacteria bacterium CG10_big_fil_rev_8_21_14_0_10_42_22]|uniref:Uncharacterized protein n=1 Tax=Candidatus Colwellbacteria bacterium CG10_big_fil_rev_8_21_14_0_10_42_22 TaxID=1974540 RepID=A0A2H0VGI4_9BACT|nr:MAG: hypothetical protein COT89_00720 [Candidatus Colwellbacteria bacterium CG10_big_fil_rev_8_21_14_0_10_42_22]